MDASGQGITYRPDIWHHPIVALDSPTDFAMTSRQGGTMKRAFLAICISLFAVHSFASATCTAQATEKKLGGTALASFMKKCEADSKSACEASAKEKKLTGAAQGSFLKKCVADAVGSK